MPEVQVKTSYIKVAKLPGKLVKIEHDAEGNMTVEMALEEAGIEVGENQEVSLNGEKVALNAPVGADDRVTVAAGAKGALVTVVIS